MNYVCSQFLVANDLDTFRKFPHIADAEALLWVPPGNPKVLIDLWPHVPAVKWTHGFFAGVDALKDFMKERLQGSEIPLSNGKGAVSESLAEYILAASLHFNKQIPRCMQNRQNKKWDKFVMNTIQGKTMGFVGFGHIGQCAAKAAKAAFGMRILALRRNTSKGSNYGGVADETFGPDQKLEVFKQSDFVVCVLPGTEQTRDFCSKEEFAAMKQSGVFISCGRGLAVDEDALHAALSSGSIAGAALDVYKTEPLPEDSPLWDCENLLLTAHNADYTADYFELGWRVWRQNFDKYKAGQALATPVDVYAGY